MAGYVPRTGNAVQNILREHFPEFQNIYDANYSTTHGKFNLERISESVERFLDCGDYSKGIARIQCTNPDCDYEYFLPFPCKQWYLCPSCN
jgi:hypothetical protein